MWENVKFDVVDDEWDADEWTYYGPPWDADPRGCG